jgi:UDP-N-acetylmuramoylalanine-D-glutamate ligase
MLEGFIPKTNISVFNNIYNCHLDWHRGFENYKNAKLNILKNAEHALINFEFKDFDEVKTLSLNTQTF